MSPEPKAPPKYNSDAGTQLAGNLGARHSRLSAYVGQRATFHDQHLKAQTSDNRCGGKRDAFEKAYKSQQSALSDLLDQVLKAQAAGDHANEQARSAQTRSR